VLPSAALEECVTKCAVFVCVLAVLCGGCTGSGSIPAEPPPLSDELRSELATWLAANGTSPQDYVVDLFSGHDVVFLGEQHRVKHDVEFVQSLVEPLYDVGVRVLATEFGRREDQTLIDSLLAKPQWDETLAREIVFRQFVWWGYREYVDVYKSVWALNQRLPEGESGFRIIGINDSPDWSHIEDESDRDDPDVMRRVWRGGGEDHWAEAILESVRSGEKVLVHCGIHHAFTGYRQPIVADGRFVQFDSSLRCGNHVRADLGSRAVTVYLHAPWVGPAGYGSHFRHPADGVIDALMLEEGPRPVGFDIVGSPFGELRIADAVYRHGYEDFRLKDFCDGWVYTRPISQYFGVSPIAEWINEGNLDRARMQSPNPLYREASAEEFNASIAGAARVDRRWGARLR
jgi:hypothetical protein